MPTSMEKLLNGAGLAIVNQIFNERLSELGGGSGGVNWEATPYTNMNYASNTSILCCAILSVEQRNSTTRNVRGLVIAHVKSDGYSGIQQVLSSLPGDFPTLTFAKVSNSISNITGTGTIKVEMTGIGSKVTFRINPESASLSGGLYIGTVIATVAG